MKNKPRCQVCKIELEPEQKSYCANCQRFIDVKKGMGRVSVDDQEKRKSTKKKLKKLLAKSQVRDPFERLPVYLTFADVEMFEDFLKVYDPTHRLLVKLAEVKQVFFDDIARRHEIEAREKSNAWWDQPENWVNTALRNERMAYAKKVKRGNQGIENLKAARKRRKQEAEEIPALPSSELRNGLIVTGLIHPSGDVGE